jgi:hypothetical protein
MRPPFGATVGAFVARTRAAFWQLPQVKPANIVSMSLAPEVRAWSKLTVP